jgi:hypothetical protein
MEIIILKSRLNTINKYKIWWEIYSKKKKVASLIYFIVGLLYLLNSFYNRDINESFWNFSSTFGFAFIISSVIYFFNHLRARRGFLYQMGESQVQDGQTTITENSISYKDESVQSEIKWQYYTHYKFYKGTLFLMRNNDLNSSVLFNNRDMPEEQFAILLKFVKENTKPAV